MSDEYYLRPAGTRQWQAATKEQFMEAERAEGFIPGYRGEPATAGFTGSTMEGTTFGPLARGLADSAAGRTKDLGDFTQYLGEQS